MGSRLTSKTAKFAATPSKSNTLFWNWSWKTLSQARLRNWIQKKNYSSTFDWIRSGFANSTLGLRWLPSYISYFKNRHSMFPLKTKYLRVAFSFISCNRSLFPDNTQASQPLKRCFNVNPKSRYTSFKLSSSPMREPKGGLQTTMHFSSGGNATATGVVLNSMNSSTPAFFAFRFAISKTFLSMSWP